MIVFGKKKMKEILMPISVVYRKESSIRANARKSENCWTFVLLFGIFVGVAFDLLGLVMSGVAYFEVSESSKQINQIGTWLIAAAFPLVMLGAHALDKIKQIETTKR